MTFAVTARGRSEQDGRCDCNTQDNLCIYLWAIAWVQGWKGVNRMSKYIIDVGDAYVRHGLERTLTIPVRINEHEDHWMDTRIPLTPYTEPDTSEAYQQGYEEGYAVGEAKKEQRGRRSL